MKKITSFLLLVAILTSLLSLSSCEERTDWLRSSNYDQYLSINMYCADTKISTSPLSDSCYSLYCIVHVEVSSNNSDYRFDNASITLSPKSGIWEKTNDVTLELDGYGTAHASFSYYNARSADPIFPSVWEFEVTGWGGTVIIP